MAVKYWVCELWPGAAPRGGPGFTPCPQCRELPTAEHAAGLMDEFNTTWFRLGFGVPPVADAVLCVFEDLLERKVIE